MLHNPCHMLLGCPNEEERGKWYMQHTRRDGEFMQNWSVNLEGIDVLGDIGVGGRMISRWALEKRV